MAKIDQLELPNGVTYDFDDKYARKLTDNDFDTINVTELNAGDLIVTGVGRFTNGLYGNLTGNASTASSATKATQDESGNNIKDTYANSFNISDHTITLKNKNGTSLGTVTVPDNNTTYTLSADTTNNKITLTPSSGTAQSITVPYATSAGIASNLANFENNNSTGKNANDVTYNAHTYYTSNGPSTSIGASTNDGALYTQAYSTSWVCQIAQDYRNGNLFTRGKNNGTWQAWRKVAYAGDAPTAHNQSADTITSGYLNIQPENSPILIPFINNDLAYMITRGGSTIVKYDGTTQSVDISGCFDAGAGYGYAISNSGDYTTIVMELTLHQTFTWTNTIYVDFGSSGWRAKDVEIEVMNTNYSGDTWTSKYHNTSNASGHCYVITSHKPSGASNTGGGFNKIRFTFQSFNSSIFRIAQLGVYNYGSAGLRTTYMSRGIDDAVWRNISPATTNKYNLGSTSLKWADAYATTFHGALDGNAATATNASKVNNLTVQTAVPANAVFTDTTYTIGTSGNNVTLTPSSGSVQSITVPYATSAGSATKATQDESGNNIKASYASSFSIDDHTITLKNKNGVSLDTIDVPNDFIDPVEEVTTPCSIATFEGAALPMPSLKVSVEAKQDLHGYDKPWVGGAGKNKYNKNNTNNQPNKRVSTSSGGTYTADGYTATYLVEVKPNTDYTLTTSSNFISYICWYDETQTRIGGTNWKSGTSKTSPSNAKYIRFDFSTADIDTVQLEQGSTATSFAPYSNICPISGWSEVNVSDVGDDIWTGDDTYTRVSTGYIIPSTTISLPIGTYAFEFDCSNPNGLVQFEVFKNNSQQGADRIYNSDGFNVSTHNRVKFTINEAGTNLRLYSNNSSGISISNVRLYSTVVTTTITLPQTVYGGEVDVVNGGENPSNLAYVELPSTGWAQESGTTNVFTNYAIKATTPYPQLICSHSVRASSYNNVINTDSRIGLSTSRVIWHESSFATVEELEQYLANNTVQIAYELATPTTFTTSPTPIKSLNGTNNLSVDCGDVIEAHYVRPEYDEITAKVAEKAGSLMCSAGTATNPVYIDNGVPTACTYELNKTVPSDAVFTDTTYSAGTGLTLSGTQFSISTANASTIMNLLTTGSSAPTDNDYYIAQYAGGGTSTTTYHRRPHSALWSYIKGKTDATYLPLAGGTMTGQIVLASTGYKTNSTTGYVVDQYGNFKHQSTNTNEYWVIANNAGTAKLSVYWETGKVVAAGDVQSATVLCANTANSSTAGGLSLYGTDPTAYGIIFRGTENQGKHGYVQSDWATYFTMNGADTRGWVFKNAASGKGNVASISSAGHAVFGGSVTIGGNTTNTSGCRQIYNSTTNSLDFIFVS